MPADPRRSLIALVALVAVLGAACVASSARSRTNRIAAVVEAAADAQASVATLDTYGGLGTWIDIYDASWDDPAAAVASMKAHGVRTLYLQTSNFNRHRPFVHADGVREFVDAAHAEGLSIVAWYLPGFRDVDLDVRRSMAAIRYRTPSGNAFDSFALDIESPTVRMPQARTRRLLSLSDRLRRAAGDAYPLGAIIPSPRGMQRNATYWPHVPYRKLADRYDVFLPMTYFTWRVSGPAGARSYTTGNIHIIREETGDPSVPIHVIGGIAGGANANETAGFVQAVRERGVMGASYYTFPLIRAGDWRSLSKIAAPQS
jgi:hypothetical protein